MNNVTSYHLLIVSFLIKDLSQSSWNDNYSIDDITFDPLHRTARIGVDVNTIFRIVFGWRAPSVHYTISSYNITHLILRTLRGSRTVPPSVTCAVLIGILSYHCHMPRAGAVQLAKCRRCCVSYAARHNSISMTETRVNCESLCCATWRLNECCRQYVIMASCARRHHTRNLIHQWQTYNYQRNMDRSVRCRSALFVADGEQWVRICRGCNIIQHCLYSRQLLGGTNCRN